MRSQHGFRTNDCNNVAITSMYDDLPVNLESNKIICLLILMSSRVSIINYQYPISILISIRCNKS